MSCLFSDIRFTPWQFVSVRESHRGANYPASRSVTGALLRACASIVVAGSGLRLTLLPRPGQRGEPGAGLGNVCGTTLAVANAARGLGCRAGERYPCRSGPALRHTSCIPEADSCGVRPRALAGWRLKPAPQTTRPNCRWIVSRETLFFPESLTPSTSSFQNGRQRRETPEPTSQEIVT